MYLKISSAKWQPFCPGEGLKSKPHLPGANELGACNVVSECPSGAAPPGNLPAPPGKCVHHAI